MSFGGKRRGLVGIHLLVIIVFDAAGDFYPEFGPGVDFLSLGIWGQNENLGSVVTSIAAQGQTGAVATVESNLDIFGALPISIHRHLTGRNGFAESDGDGFAGGNPGCCIIRADRFYIRSGTIFSFGVILAFGAGKQEEERKQNRKMELDLTSSL